MLAIRVRRKLILGVILALILGLLLFFYQFSRPILPQETDWRILVGKEKVTSFEFLSWFDQDARLYTLPQKNEVILAPSSQFYVFPWSPKNKKEGRYVWDLNLQKRLLKPILYEKFLNLKPQLPGELPKSLQDVVQKQLEYEIAKTSPLPEMVVEVIRLNGTNTSYIGKLSVSNYRRIQRRRFGTEFVNDEPRGWHTGIYYSGIMQLEIFSLSQPTQPLVAMQKEFKNWNYPLRRNDSKLIQPSFIGAFCKLYFLPDSRPIFMIFSQVYRGIYQVRQGIDDAAFGVIVPF